MTTEIILPEMGEGVIEGLISAWLKQVGDEVEEFEPIVEVETDKVTTEVVAETSGILQEIRVAEGETVAVGTVLGVIKGSAGADTTDEDEAPAAEPAPATAAAPATTHTRSLNSNGHHTKTYSRKLNNGRMSPVVARMVAEHDLEFAEIEGTGRDGRVTKKDVLAFMETVEEEEAEAVPVQKVAQPAITTKTLQPERPVSKPQPAPTPQPTPAPAAPVDMGSGELVKLTGMRRAIADHMVRSKQTSPHVSTFFEFDYSAVVAHRAAHKAQFAKDGVKLTYMPYLIMATVEALKKHPLVNAQWTEEGILLKKEINLGMATAVPSGLIVPVIKGADGLNLLGLSRTVNDLADRARDNKLQPNEVQGGTFTITNHGASGSLMGTPIINQPQVGILGVGLIEKRVKVINDAIAIRPCAYVSFSFDHRILDGATADAFVMDIKQRIENWPM